MYVMRMSAKSFQKLVALKRFPVSRDVATSLCATLKHYTESCVFAVFARLQWAVPPVCSTYKPLLRQMLSCPVVAWSGVPCSIVQR